MLIIKLLIIGVFVFVFGCATKIRGVHGCIQIGTPHFGGDGVDLYPLDSIFVTGINQERNGCLGFPKAICNGKLDSIFGAASVFEYRDESSIKRKDTVWLFITKTSSGIRKEVLYNSGTMPNTWVPKGNWSKIDGDTCMFIGKELDDPENTVIKVACSVLPDWVLESRP